MLGRTFVGSLVASWGVFNGVEGVIDHHILNIHQVVERPDHLTYDIAFLVSGVVFLTVGFALIRAGRGDSRMRGGVA
ncbi:DUF2243 domain-containing protein [Tundrisphaera lichenicola]|uniref:DUF2243 domain-containing protein n=1 Tax=Tundrisphaera lichenicola TaxID=2029860 RepID=UPI003EBFDC3C